MGRILVAISGLACAAGAHAHTDHAKEDCGDAWFYPTPHEVAVTYDASLEANVVTWQLPSASQICESGTSFSYGTGHRLVIRRQIEADTVTDGKSVFGGWAHFRRYVAKLDEWNYGTNRCEWTDNDCYNTRYVDYGVHDSSKRYAYTVQIDPPGSGSESSLPRTTTHHTGESGSLSNVDCFATPTPKDSTNDTGFKCISNESNAASDAGRDGLGVVTVPANLDDEPVPQVQWARDAAMVPKRIRVSGGNPPFQKIVAQWDAPPMAGIKHYEVEWREGTSGAWHRGVTWRETGGWAPWTGTLTIPVPDNYSDGCTNCNQKVKRLARLYLNPNKSVASCSTSGEAAACVGSGSSLICMTHNRFGGSPNCEDTQAELREGYTKYAIGGGRTVATWDDETENDVGYQASSGNADYCSATSCPGQTSGGWRLGLKWNTLYQARVRACRSTDSTDCGAWSTIQSARTLGDR